MQALEGAADAATLLAVVRNAPGEIHTDDLVAAAVGQQRPGLATALLAAGEPATKEALVCAAERNYTSLLRRLVAAAPSCVPEALDGLADRDARAAELLCLAAGRSVPELDTGRELGQAASKGDVEMVHLLLERGRPTPMDVLNALSLAVSARSELALVTLLLSALLAQPATKPYAATVSELAAPLRLAAGAGRADLVGCFLQRVPGFTTEQLGSALARAARSRTAFAADRKEVVRLLLDAGAAMGAAEEAAVAASPHRAQLQALLDERATAV